MKTFDEVFYSICVLKHVTADAVERVREQNDKEVEALTNAANATLGYEVYMRSNAFMLLEDMGVLAMEEKALNHFVMNLGRLLQTGVLIGIKMEKPDV